MDEYSRLQTVIRKANIRVEEIYDRGNVISDNLMRIEGENDEA